MHDIEWTVKAFRQVNKIKDQKVKTKIIDAVETLKRFPCVGNVVSLQNSEDYRLRVGRWRVIFGVEHRLKIIEIQEVKIRNEGTY